MNRLALLLAIAAAVVSGCRRGHAYVYVETHAAPPPACSVYYYDAPTVTFVAEYCNWPRSRVEYYFSIGWSCNDLIVAVEFSRRCRRPWKEVVHHYDHYRTVYREEHHVTVTTVEERQYIWTHVATEMRVSASASVELHSLTVNASAYAEVEQNIVSQAIAHEYSCEAAQAEMMIEKGYDTAEVVRAYQSVERYSESSATEHYRTADVEHYLESHHVEWERRETAVDMGRTSELQEAVPDAQEPDWTPAQEDGVDDAPADE